MQPKKLGRETSQRMAILRNQVSTLFWTGRVSTTYARAKATAALAEKYLTLAIRTYADTLTVEKEFTNDKGVKSKRKVLVDGPKKLAARRKLMANLYDLQEIRSKDETKRSFDKRTKNINHPIIEKVFNELAPKYAKRAKETGTAGGYTRVLKTGIRKGDDAMTAIVELV